MGGSWFAYILVFVGCFLSVLLIGGLTGFLYLVARRRGELDHGRVRVVGLTPASGEESDGG